jgi:hypothetical protein
MRSHISVHRATSKYFSNSFIFKNKIEKEGLPGDSTPDLGAGGRGFSIFQLRVVTAFLSQREDWAHSPAILAQQSEHARPRTPSIPSSVMMGTMTRAANGSAHHKPKKALSSKPTRRIDDR